MPAGRRILRTPAACRIRSLNQPFSLPAGYFYVNVASAGTCRNARERKSYKTRILCAWSFAGSRPEDGKRARGWKRFLSVSCLHPARRSGGFRWLSSFLSPCLFVLEAGRFAGKGPLSHQSIIRTSGFLQLYYRPFLPALPSPFRRILHPEILGVSGLYRQFLPLIPFVPGAVVIGQMGVAEHGESKQHGCGGDPAVAIGNDLRFGLRARFGDDLRQLFRRSERALLREEGFARQVAGTGDMPAAFAAPDPPRILALVPRVDQSDFGLIQGLQHLFRRRAPFRMNARREHGWPVMRRLCRHRPVLPKPLP